MPAKSYRNNRWAVRENHDDEQVVHRNEKGAYDDQHGFPPGKDLTHPFAARSSMHDEQKFFRYDPAQFLFLPGHNAEGIL